MCARILTFLVAAIAVRGAGAADRVPTTKPVIADYAKAPLSFEPNQGQTDKQVDFFAHGNGYGLFLSRAEAVIVLQRGAPATPNSHISPAPIGSAVVRLKPVGANASAPPVALDQQPSKSNYFIGNVPDRSHIGIPNYAKVRYRNVYPGVDMIYRTRRRDDVEHYLPMAKAWTDIFGKTSSDAEGRWKGLFHRNRHGAERIFACCYATQIDPPGRERHWSIPAISGAALMTTAARSRWMPTAAPTLAALLGQCCMLFTTYNTLISVRRRSKRFLSRTEG
jgi:hypothetical protein